MRGVFLVGAVLALAGHPGRAGAQPRSDADTAIARGIELRRQGRDDEALLEFQRAHDLAPTPRARAQIALAEQAIGRWVDAERHLEEALSAGGDAWINKHRTVLEEALGVIRNQLGTVAVRGEPAGAVVDVDGRVVGKVPLGDTRVVAGQVVVTVAAPGYLSVSRKVNVSAGGRRAEIFTLKREIDSPAPAASAVALLEPPPPPREPPFPRSPDGWKRVAAWSAAGAAVLSLAGGVAFQLLAGHNRDTFGDETRGCGIDEMNRVVGGAPCVDLKQSWERDRTLAIVGYVAGGAFAVTSAVLFLTSAPPAGDGNREARVTCLPNGPTGVSCALRF